MTSPVRPTRKKKRGILVWVRPCDCVRKWCAGTHWTIGNDSVFICKDMRRAGLKKLQPGEKRKVRVIIEEP